MSHYFYLNPNDCRHLYPANNGSSFTVRLDAIFQAGIHENEMKKWKCGLIQTCFSSNNNNDMSFYICSNLVHDSFTGCGRRPILRQHHTILTNPNSHSCDEYHSISNQAVNISDQYLQSAKVKDSFVTSCEDYANVIYVPLRLYAFDTIEIYLKTQDWKDICDNIQLKYCVLHLTRK